MSEDRKTTMPPNAAPVARLTSNPPKVKLAKIWKAGILDLAGIVAAVGLAFAGMISGKEALVFVGVVLGLMRWQPIGKSGGPLTALVAAALPTFVKVKALL